MKTRLSILLIICLIKPFNNIAQDTSFKTGCLTITILNNNPWIENFSVNTALDCWTLQSDEGDWYISDSALYHDWDVGTIAEAMTPLLDLTALTTPYVKFDHYQPTYNNGVHNNLTLLYRASENDKWVELKTYTNEIASYQTDSIALPGPSATYQLNFRWSNPNTDADGVYIDNIKVYNETNPPACIDATAVTFSSITSNQAKISWVQLDSSSSWIVKYRIKNETASNVWSEEVVNTNPTIILNNLSSNVTYEVYIITICSTHGNNYHMTNVYTFKTLCGGDGLTLPYYNGFEELNPLECYIKAKSVDIVGMNGGNFPKEYSGYPTTTYNNSQTSIEFRGTNQILVLPAFANDVDLSTARIKLYVQKNYQAGTTATMEVGIMIDPNDITTFESLGTVTAGVGDYGMIENIISFANLTNGGKYIAIYFKNPTNIGSYYVDEITVESIPTCSKIEGKLTCVDADNTSATIKFEDAQDQTAWIIYYKKTMDSNYTNVNITDKQYTITNLEASMEYQVYVIRSCLTGNELAEKSNVVKFKTTTIPYSMTNNQDSCSMKFEDVMDNKYWRLSSGSENKWVIGYATNNGGQKSLYISDDDGTSNKYNSSSLSNSYASLLIRFSDKAEYTLTFDYKVKGEKSSWGSYSYDYLSVYLCDGNYELPTSGIPEGITLLNQITNETDWQSFKTILNGVQNTTKQIVFYWRNDGNGGGQPPAAIDNVILLGSDCLTTNNLAVIGISESSATITWDTVVNQTYSWQVQYRKEGDSVWQESSIVSGQPIITLNNLTASSTYEYRVVTLCSGLFNPVSDISIFRTSCNIIDLSAYVDGIWKQNFENLSSTSLEDLCFTLTKTAIADNGTFPYVQNLVGQGSAHTGLDDGSFGPGHALECKGGDIILTLPRFNVDISLLRFKFWYR